MPHFYREISQVYNEQTPRDRLEKEMDRTQKIMD
jgi:hypothetical protein